ncbi:MAG TPA: diguanylate cyclase [Acidiferrobacteraceae bacterium]|nr:diguanylate cyclase [Acidiferrobacteraceae bacterium]HEX19790.1 diguanylate cyclase [Acidiferrobacteraceae bacterium]
MRVFVMRIGHSYQHRIIISLGLIGLIMVIAMTTAYFLSRNATLQQAHQGLATLGRYVEDEINRGANLLQKQTNIVRNHLGLRRKVYGVVKLNREAWPLRAYMRQHFSWLQDHRIILVSRTSEVLAGERQHGLAQELVKSNKQITPQKRLIYVQNNKGLTHMATAPIYYGNHYLGLVAVAQLLDQSWMDRMSKVNGGQFVLVYDDKVVLSTLPRLKKGDSFMVDDGYARLMGASFLAHRLKLINKQEPGPQLWILRSRAVTLQPMQSQAWWYWFFMLVLAITLAMIGRHMYRGFIRPLDNIKQMVGVLKSGHIPKSKKIVSDKEFAYIERQFGKLARTLHNKINELSAMRAQKNQPVLMDTLTGLGNRSQLSNMYTYHAVQVQENNSCMTVILVDIDGLRKINAKYSHVVGDHAVMHVASLLRSCVEENDLLFRTAGGEFLIMTTDVCDGGLAMAEKIRAQLEHSPMKYEDRILDITASFGVIEVDKLHRVVGLESLMTRAKNAVRTAKTSGRNRVAVGNLEVVRKKA